MSLFAIQNIDYVFVPFLNICDMKQLYRMNIYYKNRLHDKYKNELNRERPKNVYITRSFEDANDYLDKFCKQTKYVMMRNTFGDSRYIEKYFDYPEVKLHYFTDRFTISERYYYYPENEKISNTLGEFLFNVTNSFYVLKMIQLFEFDLIVHNRNFQRYYFGYKKTMRTLRKKYISGANVCANDDITFYNINIDEECLLASQLTCYILL